MFTKEKWRNLGLGTGSSKGRVIEIFDYRDISFDGLGLYQVRHSIV
ncbi:MULTISPECIES: hypothetical protein [Clostridium]|uniref:Uncharacterized protein n=1 Tax=Clostridium frigoriphilum TaxID=443253 RepID=A0ABU7UHR1_9CLOT|nr:hypothetical protein [Clostridium sp. DSM 17811]MBU3098421.1 hypothetical protein [Clostridium sp. DSM 17811]